MAFAAAARFGEESFHGVVDDGGGAGGGAVRGWFPGVGGRVYDGPGTVDGGGGGGRAVAEFFEGEG
jgi:hypothetical protein